MLQVTNFCPETVGHITVAFPHLENPSFIEEAIFMSTGRLLDRYEKRRRGGILKNPILEYLWKIHSRKISEFDV